MKNHKFNFFIFTVVLLLLCALALPMFISCSNEQSKQPDADSPIPGDQSDSGGADDAPDPDAPDLPKSVDMDGKIFTMLTYTGWGGDTSASDIAGEELTGDPIHDAAYNRRVKLEQLFNCKIKVVNPVDHTETVTNYRTAILAGDTTYDFAITPCANFTSLLTGNFLTDFKELVHLDVDKPYWNKNFYDTMSLMGRSYALDGDISRRNLECVWIMAFNKEMIKDNGFESPYDLVEEGRWTYDKMHEMARAAAKDLNGDGKMDETDLWGLNYTGDTIMGIINSVGVRIAEINPEGIPELIINSETNLEKMYRIYTDMRNDEYSIDTLFRLWLGDADIFAENRCLFLACATHNIGGEDRRTLREMDVDFGIIPYPKWDAGQPDYTPFTAGNYHPVLTVPQVNYDLENTGILLEAMAYEGMKHMKPAFYESLLKTKTARDDESAAMIDFIFGNLQYDVGVMFNFGNILGEFGYEMSTNVRANIVSTIERNTGRWQRAIDTLIAEIEKHD